jgi:hypothetical protein
MCASSSHKKTASNKQLHRKAPGEIHEKKREPHPTKKKEGEKKKKTLRRKSNSHRVPRTF